MEQVLRERGSPLFGRLAAKELVCSQDSKTFNFFVDGGQQFLENHFQFIVWGGRNANAEASDPIVEAAHLHRGWNTGLVASRYIARIP